MPLSFSLSGVQIITRAYAVIFFVLCCILLFYVKLNSCSSFCLSWTGFAPLQVCIRLDWHEAHAHCDTTVTRIFNAPTLRGKCRL